MPIRRYHLKHNKYNVATNLQLAQQIEILNFKFELRDKDDEGEEYISFNRIKGVQKEVEDFKFRLNTVGIKTNKWIEFIDEETQIKETPLSKRKQQQLDAKRQIEEARKKWMTNATKSC
jgi:hypothetical protein